MIGSQLRRSWVAFGVITNPWVSLQGFQVSSQHGFKTSQDRSRAAPFQVAVTIANVKRSANSSVPIVIVLRNTSKAVLSFDATAPE